MHRLFAIGFLFIVGCSSTGSIKHNVDINVYTKVYFSEKISLFDQKYIEIVGRKLEKVGFSILQRKPETVQSDTLECRLAVAEDNVFNFRAHVSLWDGNEMIAVAEAKNSGWGTLLASGAAAKDLVARASTALEKQIRKKQTR